MNTPSSLIIRELESFSTMMRYEDMSEGQEEGSDLRAMKSPTEVTSCRSRSLQLVEDHFTWILPLIGLVQSNCVSLILASDWHSLIL